MRIRSRNPRSGMDFLLPGEIRATVFGIDEEKMVRRTIEEILARLKSEKFNSLEITRVASGLETFLGSALCDCLRPVTTSPGPGSIGCRLNERGSQAKGTVLERNGERSGLGRAREHKNEGCGDECSATNSRNDRGEQDPFGLDIESA